MAEALQYLSGFGTEFASESLPGALPVLNRDAVELAIKAGLALNSDLLDAEVALLQAKITHSQALVDSEVLRAKLAKSVDSEGR